MTKIPEGRTFRTHMNGLRGGTQARWKGRKKVNNEYGGRKKRNIQQTGKDGRKNT
jgi:hypothetical protein